MPAEGRENPLLKKGNSDAFFREKYLTKNIHDRYGYHTLDRVLRLAVGTWEGVPQSLSANMLNGIARLLHAFGDSLKEEIFQEKLSRISIRELVRTANERRAGSLGFAEAMLIYYNKKTHSNALNWEKLYSGKPSALS